MFKVARSRMTTHYNILSLIFMEDNEDLFFDCSVYDVYRTGIVLDTRSDPRSTNSYFQRDWLLMLFLVSKTAQSKLIGKSHMQYGIIELAFHVVQVSLPRIQSISPVYSGSLRRVLSQDQEAVEYCMQIPAFESIDGQHSFAHGAMTIEQFAKDAMCCKMNRYARTRSDPSKVIFPH